MKKKILALTLALALVLSLGGAAFAEEENIPALPGGVAGTFDIQLVCTDWGQPVTAVVLNLVEALPDDIVEADIVAAFTVFANGITYFSYEDSQNHTEDLMRVITGAEISADRMTIKLNLLSLAVVDNANKSTFASYTVTQAEVLGSLAAGTIALKQGVTFDLAADKFAYFEKADTGLDMPYRLFTPDKAEHDADSYPMILWLHGGGEFADDNEIHITANLVTNWASDEVQDIFGGAYVLAPQSSGQRDENGALPPHDAEKIMAVIMDVIENNPDVDLSRIYVGGCSMGGMGTWDTILAYPDFFAAAFPICSAKGMNEAYPVQTAEEIASVAHMPIYFVHAANDNTCDISTSIIPYEMLIEAGADNVHMTIFDYVTFNEMPEFMLDFLGHWSWVYVHTNFPSEVYADRIIENGSTVVSPNTEIVYENVTSEFPGSFGYDTFMHWLADQRLGQDAPVALPFTDLGIDAALVRAVRNLYENGITNGYTATTFAPANGLTRAEFMTFLCRVAGTASASEEASFDDCVGHWANGFINWGVEAGLIQGYGDGVFGPDDSLTIEQVNIILNRFNDAFGTEIPAAIGEGDATRGDVALVLFSIAQ